MKDGVVSAGVELAFPALAAVRMHGASVEITLGHGDREQIWKPVWHPANGGGDLRAEGFDLAATLRTDQGKDDSHTIALTLHNLGAQPIRIRRVAPLVVDAGGGLQIGADAAQWSVFRQGYQSWTGTRSFRATETDLDPWPHPLAISLIDLRNRSPQRPGHFRSDTYVAIKNLRSGEALVAGFLRNDEAFGGIEVAIEGERCARFAASLDYDDIEIAPGAELSCPPLWVAAGLDEHRLIETYMDAVGLAMRARVPEHNPVGWCSWYYYFTDISEERITENLTGLSSLRERFHFDYFQVDDGYQAEIGDWTTPNDRFPRGMGWIAEQIRGAGFDAGIWTAPFIAKPESQLMREHPDWFVRTDRGKPVFALWNPAWGVRSSCFVLDATHPRVLDWLGQTFHTIAREWGYRVLKLDFLYAAALPGRRYDAGATRAVALRRGLDAIREAAGEDAFLLGCGCPLGPAIGVVDAMRIGPDVAPWWSNVLSRSVQRNMHGLATLHAIRNTLTRAYSHRRWWLNDPDCLMVRDTNTSLTDDEVRTLASVIALTDGMIIFSDRIEKLSAARLDLLDRTLRLAGGKVRVADLMQSDIPELIVSRGGDKTIVGAFNFTDQPQPKRIDLRALGVDCVNDANLTDWWTDIPIQVRDGRADLGTIPAHGCRVFVFPELL